MPRWVCPAAQSGMPIRVRAIVSTAARADISLRRVVGRSARFGETDRITCAGPQLCPSGAVGPTQLKIIPHVDVKECPIQAHSHQLGHRWGSPAIHAEKRDSTTARRNQFADDFIVVDLARPVASASRTICPRCTE